MEPTPPPGERTINRETPRKKRSLGQHFLADHILAERIVSSAEINRNSHVIEIGPGAGSLTKWIHDSSPASLTLIELDRRLIDDLKSRFPDAEVINEDVCQLDIARLGSSASRQFTVMGNLPYNVSTRILEHLIGYRDQIDSMVLMFQKEVGDRIYADLSTKDYGRLTLLAQEFFITEKLLTIKPGSFDPPPKVDSVVIRFTKRERPLVDIHARDVYDAVVRCVFSGRRKMIRRSLRSIYSEQQLNDLFSTSGIAPTKRPEELSIQEFAIMSNILSQKA